MNKEKKGQRINAFCSKQVTNILEELAAYNGQTKSKIVREAIREKYLTHLQTVTK
jgi:predicted DNA-binding protein